MSPRMTENSNAAGGKPSYAPFIAGIVALAFMVFACLPTLKGLTLAWQSEEYSHGYIIPIIALFIGWHRLVEKKPSVEPCWSGIGVLIIGALFLVIGRLSAFEPPAQYGVLIALVGLCMAVMGRKVTSVLAPAFIYLVFCIPLPRLIYVGLSQNLQLISSTLGALPLDWLGIPVYQDGNVIDLGGFKLQVVEACSGLRYLFPLMSFGFLIAFLLDDKFWKRAVLFLSTIPITIFMNAARIAFIGVTVDMWGPKMASGFLHDFEGWTLFLVCVAVLMSEVWVLQHIGNRGRFRYEYFGMAQGKLISGPMRLTSSAIGAVVVTALMAGFLGTHFIEERPEVVPSHPPFSTLNTDVGDWHGQQGHLEEDVLKALQLSDYWFGSFTRSDKEPLVNFYMAYYESQRVGSSAHSPSNCIPGGGWEIVSNTVKTLALPDGQSIKLSRLLIKRDEDMEIVYYWFDERGRDLTEQYGAKWYLLMDSIFMHRTDGGMVRLVTAVSKNETQEAAEKRLDDFLGVIYPQIHTFIPK